MGGKEAWSLLTTDYIDVAMSPFFAFLAHARGVLARTKVR